MEFLNEMDSLLAGAEANGRKPLHFIIRQEDWEEIGEQFRRNLVPDPEAIGANTYRGVPVHFGNYEGAERVGLMDGPLE